MEKYIIATDVGDSYFLPTLCVIKFINDIQYVIKSDVYRNEEEFYKELDKAKKYYNCLEIVDFSHKKRNNET